MQVDKAKLLAPRVDTPAGWPEDDVEVPGFGTFRVRGLSRFEIAVLKKAGKDESNMDGGDIMAVERKYLAAGILEPSMSEAEVGEWQKIPGAALEINPVMAKIQQLSGQEEDSAKAAYKSNGGGPSNGVRVLPSDQAGHDGVRVAEAAE
jgi:hypothetical protein